MRTLFSLSLMAMFLTAVTTGCGSQAKDEVPAQGTEEEGHAKEVKRVGMVIKIKPEFIEEYKALHADSNAGVRDLLTEANMHNFSIFLHQLDDGNWYEFGYYEYTGDDFEADMAKLDKHPRNIEWLEICDPMQVPLEGYDGWAEMEQVYFNE
jgi:L-rhamnose mutarotase